MKRIVTSQAIVIFTTFGLQAINEELGSRNMKPVDTGDASKDAEAGASLLAMGVRSLDEFAATVVNLSHGEIDGDRMTELMQQAFPNHSIGKRHGPHYTCHARNGNLGGDIVVRYTVPKAKRKSGGGKPSTTDLSNVELDRLKIMLSATEGTPFATLIAAEIQKREVAAPPAPETPSTEAPQAPVEETHRQRRQRERREQAAASK